MPDIFTGAELAARGHSAAWLRARDGGALGTPASWPPRLATGLRIVLSAPDPMWLWWGQDCLHVHNDAAAPLLGGAAALARPARTLWPQAFAGDDPQTDDWPETGLLLSGAGADRLVLGVLPPDPMMVPARLAAAARLTQADRAQDGHALLMHELHHRVRNTLATVQAMARQSFRAADPALRDTFLARLFALSGQHALLATAGWEGARLDSVLERALDGWPAVRGRVTAEGPSVPLDAKRALALGLAFHELIANAAQHGALGQALGTVTVRWTAAAGRLRLTWTERGGPAPAPPQRAGFGFRLLEQGLARETSGTVALRLEPEGLVCTWEMPLPHRHN